MLIFYVVKHQEELHFNNIKLKVLSFVNLGEYKQVDCKNKLGNHGPTFMFVALQLLEIMGLVPLRHYSVTNQRASLKSCAWKKLSKDYGATFFMCVNIV